MSDPSVVAVAEAALDDLLASSPEWATALGDHRFDDRLADLSDEGLRELGPRSGSERGSVLEPPPPEPMK